MGAREATGRKPFHALQPSDLAPGFKGPGLRVGGGGNTPCYNYYLLQLLLTHLLVALVDLPLHTRLAVAYVPQQPLPGLRQRLQPLPAFSGQHLYQ